MKDSYRVVGLMSGTSLDGLDIALCEFRQYGGSWSHTLHACETIDYPPVWKELLLALPALSGVELYAGHIRYGRFLGEQVKFFLERQSTTADFIASHGHTVFHQPRNGFTFQAGDGATLAAISGLPVVSDFRTSDVALGGQGAPLVPVGDRMLFSQYAYCLNLGGIANVSFESQNKRTAYDICPCNLLLNELAGRAGQSYDASGSMARSGKVLEQVLDQLESLSYYRASGPKSLGREDIERDFLPILHAQLPLQDLLRTVTEHIARRIGAVIDMHTPKASLLVTGGGAWNTFLIERIAGLSHAEVVVPEKRLVDFKEALVFAFLGMLRWKNEVNVLASVTGASRDHVAGVVSFP